MSRPVCIYHGGCDDGFAAAWAVRQAIGNCEFYPGVYQKEPPDVANRDVIFVDFSYKRPVLEAMSRSANSILILDHHKTAAEDLAGLQAPFGAGWQRHLDNVYQDTCEGVGGKMYASFDMARSGAMMAWEFFHPDADVPEFIRYIQDRDLWRKQLPNGDEFTIALRSYPQDFDVWTRLIAAGPRALIDEGHAIQRYYRRRVDELKASAYMATLDGAPIWIANAPYFAASEVAGELALERNLCFGACYFEVSAGRWQYSLRSSTEFDVSEVAKKFGGGGHKGAAGFTVDRPVHGPVENADKTPSRMKAAG